MEASGSQPQPLICAASDEEDELRLWSTVSSPTANMLVELDELKRNSMLSCHRTLTNSHCNLSGYVQQEPEQASPELFHDAELLQDEASAVQNATKDQPQPPELQLNQVSKTRLVSP